MRIFDAKIISPAREMITPIALSFENVENENLKQKQWASPRRRSFQANNIRGPPPSPSTMLVFKLATGGTSHFIIFVAGSSPHDKRQSSAQFHAAVLLASPPASG
jgi:hypothetical protein